MAASVFRPQAKSHRRLPKPPLRLSLPLGTVALALGILLADAAGAAAARPASCSGSFQSPGTLAGTYSSNVTVEGVCAVNAAPGRGRGGCLRPQRPNG
jgi:hypothetical protein